MNTKLIKKGKSLFQSKPTSTMSTENENIIFVEPLSNKETAILKFKHFFSSKKVKINNIINSIDKILSDLIKMHQVNQYMLSHGKGR